MASHAAPLGRCPDCNATIPAGRLLIEYKRHDGPACYAEFPNCREIVRPRSRAG